MKMFQVSAWAAAVLPAMLLLTGCVFTTEPHREPMYYDLAAPTPEKPQNILAVGSFDNDTPARQRMLYREAGSRIVPDEYNQWVQSPEMLLQRYFRNAFPIAPGTDDSKLMELRGSINAFEIDLADPAAVLKINYQLSAGEQCRSGSIGIRERCDAKTPQAFANAMSRAAERAARELDKAVRSFAGSITAP